MAKQISEFTNKATPAGTDEIVIQETGGGTTKKATILAALGAAIDAAFGALTATTIDGVIGSVTPAAGTFTTFTSTGIDDNATSNAITIDSSENVGIGNTSPAAQSFNSPAKMLVVGETGTSYGIVSIVSAPTGIGYLSFADGTTGTSRYSGMLSYDHATDTLDIRTSGSIRAVVDSSGNTVVGGTTAGAASAATIYATGAGKFSTGSSGASAHPNGDDLVVEASSCGASLLSTDANTSRMIFGSPSENQGLIVDWTYDSGAARIRSNKVGATLALSADDTVTNLTLSGASGSELATFAGDVVVGGTSAGAASAVTLYADGKITSDGLFTLQNGNYSGAMLVGADLNATSLTNATNKLARVNSPHYLTAEEDVSLISASNTSTDNIIYIGGASGTQNAATSIQFLTAGNNTTTTGAANTTLSGASGSELLTAAGSVSVTDFLRIPRKSTLTIASGVVTATSSYHGLDTEAAAATDDLDTINGGTEGDILILSTASSGRDVTLKDGTGNLSLAGDFALLTSEYRITLQYNGTNWCEISRSAN